MSEKETFALALEHHKKKSYKIAEDLYEELLKKNPYHFEVIFLRMSYSIAAEVVVLPSLIILTSLISS